MKYRLISRQKESDHAEAHLGWLTGDNRVRHFSGIWRAIRDPRRTQLRLHRRGHYRPPADADELCRRRAQDRTALCSGRLLLLGPGNYRSEAGLNPAIHASGPCFDRNGRTQQEEKMKHTFLLCVTIAAIT